MVNPMQNIESKYVICDDEMMNDITTQPSDLFALMNQDMVW